MKLLLFNNAVGYYELEMYEQALKSLKFIAL